MTKVKFDELLPEQSFAILNTTGEVILIKKGENGYYPQPNLQDREVDELNETLGVTKAQAEAMANGSLFGWEVPASNPKMWEEKGIYLHNRKPDWAKK